MNLTNPVIEDKYNFKGIIDINTKNIGYTPDEIRFLESRLIVNTSDGSRGSLLGVFKKDRQPPDIKNLKSEFGYQTKLDLIDLVEIARIQNTKLDPSISVKASAYNFYIMGCGVFIKPSDDEKFKSLKFEVKFRDANVSTISMFPRQEMKTLFEANGKLDVGVNGKIDFGFPEISVANSEVDMKAKVQLETNFIVSFHFEMKAPKVDAFGSRTNFCKWFMYDAKDLRNDVSFYPIIRTPKSVTQLECEVTAHFEIEHPDWKNPELFSKRPLIVLASI